MADIERKIEQPAVSETPTGTGRETLKIEPGVNCTLCGAPRARLIRKVLSHATRTATRLFRCDACGGSWSDVTDR